MNLNNYTVVENIDTSFIGYLKMFLQKNNWTLQKYKRHNGLELTYGICILEIWKIYIGNRYITLTLFSIY